MIINEAELRSYLRTGNLSLYSLSKRLASDQNTIKSAAPQAGRERPSGQTLIGLVRVSRLDPARTSVTGLTKKTFKS